MGDTCAKNPLTHKSDQGTNYAIWTHFCSLFFSLTLGRTTLFFHRTLFIFFFFILLQQFRYVPLSVCLLFYWYRMAQCIHTSMWFERLLSLWVFGATPNLSNVCSNVRGALSKFLGSYDLVLSLTVGFKSEKERSIRFFHRNSMIYRAP